MISRTFKAAALSALIAIGSAGAVLAQDAYEQRSEAMKAMGSMAKTIGEMLQGKTDFDAEVANAAFVKAQGSMADFATYFPEGSEGGESEAAPAIWTDPDGFAEAVMKVQGDLDTAVASSPQTQDEVKAAFGLVAGNCKGCHEKYRIQK